MTKALEASCTAGIVTAGALPVVGAEILSEGVGSSSGILILDEDRKTYIPKTSGDLKTTLEKLASALGKIASTLTSIGAGMTGPTTAPPPTLAADVAQITAIQAEITALKEVLK